jgi:hypothetical protein
VWHGFVRNLSSNRTHNTPRRFGLRPSQVIGFASFVGTWRRFPLQKEHVDRRPLLSALSSRHHVYMCTFVHRRKQQNITGRHPRSINEQPPSSRIYNIILMTPSQTKWHRRGSVDILSFRAHTYCLRQPFFFFKGALSASLISPRPIGWPRPVVRCTSGGRSWAWACHDVSRCAQKTFITI